MKPAFTVLLLISSALPAVAESVAEVAAKAQPSIVMVTPENREGQDGGLGAGFVVRKDGLIATALHVIGEARPVWVRTHDGQRHEVIEIHASDRSLDLAIVRIDAQDLTPLPIAEKNATLELGEPTVAIGHPLGLRNSVVSGLIAGTREYDQVSMWQIGMTIEPGNSGCPLLDMEGQVHGVVVMKSTEEPFGFAVRSEHLRTLMDRPNPISMANWKTIGRLDRRQWQAKMGARWRQRRGQILVEGAGAGFGGRSLLLRRDQAPDVPFELAVSVKLDDEAGAAGLVFHSDGENQHYGFYPSAGRIRLTSFEGPTVFTWNVLRELETPHYKRGEWNELKVRVESNKIVGYVNGHQVVTVNDVRQPPGQVGICKFRDTKAQFKRFRVGVAIPSDVLQPATLDRIAEEMIKLAPRAELADDDLRTRTDELTARRAALEREARRLEERAAELRNLGTDLHVSAACQALKQAVGDATEKVDLLECGLWIARLDNPDLDIEVYLEAVREMESGIRKQFKAESSSAEKLQQLDAFLFEQNGFHGSRTDYYNAANSHLDRVIDDREGLPITLSVLYMTLAQRLGINVVGVGLPGHFVVRHEPEEGTSQLIDVFDRGKRLTRDEADRMVRELTGRPAQDIHYVAAKPEEILHRMLINLLGVARSTDDPAAMLRYLEAIVALNPEDASMRGMRGVLRHRQGRTRAALDDLDWILEHEPEGVDLGQVRRMRELFAK